MGPREEELKEAEISVHALLTIAIVSLTYATAVLSPSINSNLSAMIIITIIYGGYCSLTLWILSKSVWKSKLKKSKRFR